MGSFQKIHNSIEDFDHNEGESYSMGEGGGGGGEGGGLGIRELLEMMERKRLGGGGPGKTRRKNERGKGGFVASSLLELFCLTLCSE